MVIQLTGINMNGSPELSLSGGTSTTFAWDPFGGSAARTGNTLSLPGFNGERQDPLYGVTHLGNGYRAYSPALRRFTCPDSESPFGGGGINPYVYCDHDPVNNTDPSGHMPKLTSLQMEEATRKRMAALKMKSEQVQSLPVHLLQPTPETSGTASSMTGATGNAPGITQRRAVSAAPVQGTGRTSSSQVKVIGRSAQSTHQSEYRPELTSRKEGNAPTPSALRGLSTGKQDAPPSYKVFPELDPSVRQPRAEDKNMYHLSRSGGHSGSFRLTPIKGGEAIKPSGTYQFIIREDEPHQVRVGKLATPYGHTSLAYRTAKEVVGVRYAGDIQFNNAGSIIRWNNQSGHYQPSIEGAGDIVEDFRNLLPTRDRKLNSW